MPRVFVRPALRFMHLEAAGGVVMLVAAVVALVWANSPVQGSYASLWETPVDLSIGGLLHIEESLRMWVNEGLMAIFFFVMALEIKREAVHGELSDPKAASVPVLAALGGMVVPALVYVAFNAGGAGADGWGIPMATDIAFAVGVLALVGPRMPVGVKIFLLTLAIVDDIGAIVVIAVFYTDDVSLGWLVIALAVIPTIRRAAEAAGAISDPDRDPGDRDVVQPARGRHQPDPGRASPWACSRRPGRSSTPRCSPIGPGPSSTRWTTASPTRRSTTSSSRRPSPTWRTW